MSSRPSLPDIVLSCNHVLLCVYMLYATNMHLCHLLRTQGGAFDVYLNPRLSGDRDAERPSLKWRRLGSAATKLQLEPALHVVR